MGIVSKLTLFGTTAALVSGGLFSSGVHAATKQDASHYTIACDTLSKASIGFKPSLNFTGGLATSAKIKGTVSGCTATPDGTNPAITVVSGSVSGLLSAPDNNCTTLLGPTASTGTITIKWKTSGDVGLLDATTVITITSGDVTGGTAAPFADAASYGSFTISGTSQTGSFGGPSGTGAASFTKALTVEGITNLTGQCTGAKGLKTANLGSTEVNLK